MTGKAAGIRVLTALVLAASAALALFGCGGDSATETASSAATSSTTAGGGGTEQAGKPAAAKKTGTSADSAEGAKKKSPTEAEAAAEGSVPGAAKQGAAITPPKGPREPEPSPKQRAEATVVSMTLTSPALSPGPESVSPLPATYTCEGKDTWPTLQWGAVPAGTAELVLFAINIEPVDEALFFDWAVAGLDPGLTEIKSATLPKEAVLGKNSFGKPGYSICPAKSPETVIFALYALPKHLAASKGFDPTALRKEVLAISANAGLLATSYTKG
jgi:phosphatidylethanolamine-binding protein (PEBP) family uncharacterized protein